MAKPLVADDCWHLYRINGNIGVPTAFFTMLAILLCGGCDRAAKSGNPIQDSVGVDESCRESRDTSAKSLSPLVCINDLTFKGIASLSFSPNGRFLAIGATQGTVVQDLQLGTHISVSTWGFTEPVNECFFSQCGTRLVLASRSGILRFYKFPNGQEISTFKIPRADVLRLSLSQNNTMLAVCPLYVTPGLLILDAKSGTTLQHLEKEVQFSSATFSLDNQYCAAYGFGRQGRQLFFWKVGSWQCQIRAFRSSFGEGTVGINQLAFSPDGQYLGAACDDCSLRILKLASLEQVKFLKLVSAEQRFCYSSDGSMLITACSLANCCPAELSCWKVDTLEKLWTIKPHKGPITAMSMSADGTRLATGGMFDSAKCWDFGRFMTRAADSKSSNKKRL